MKKEVFLTFWFVINCFSVSLSLSSDNLYKVSPFVQKISCRMYHKSRLKKAVAILAMLSQDNASHLNTILLIKWHDFCQFKKLKDDDFVSQFIKEIFLALKKQLLNEETDSLFYETDDVEVLLNYIDTLIYYLEDKYQVCLSQKSPPMTSCDVTTDNVTLRFYMLRRLDKIYQLLTEINSYVLFKPYKNKKDRVDALELALHKITYPHLKKTVLKILYSRSIEPLLHLYNEIYQYRYVHDEHFFSEFLLVILAVYKKIGELYFLDTNAQDSIEDFSSNMSSKQIDELLPIIDTLTQDLEGLMQLLKKKNYLKQIVACLLVPMTLIGCYWSCA